MENFNSATSAFAGITANTLTGVAELPDLSTLYELPTFPATDLAVENATNVLTGIQSAMEEMPISNMFDFDFENAFIHPAIEEVRNCPSI